MKAWPEPFRNAVLEFVRNGGGFVVVHAGGTMFGDWTDFQKLIGATWGAGTGHGAKHAFEVKFTDVPHPITQGLAPFKITDELWHRMVAQPDKQILATAFSAPEQGGSGNDEPMVMVTQFGKGRGFNLVLGHDLQAIENPNFQTLLLRGTEWAATGRVTIVSANAAAADPDVLLQAIAGYKFGDSRNDVVALEKFVGAASRDAAVSRAVAAKLAAMLDRQATVECKQIVCWQLSVVGGAAEVPALAKRLGDQDLGFHARFALERIPGPESLAALRDALKTAHGKLKAGLIGSLAARRDAESVPALAAAVADPDALVAAAAIDALGMIGGRAAAEALRAAAASAPAAVRPRLVRRDVAVRRQSAGNGGLTAAGEAGPRRAGGRTERGVLGTRRPAGREGRRGDPGGPVRPGPDAPGRGGAGVGWPRRPLGRGGREARQPARPDPRAGADPGGRAALRAALPAAVQAAASRGAGGQTGGDCGPGALGDASTVAKLLGLFDGSDAERTEGDRREPGSPARCGRRRGAAHGAGQRGADRAGRTDPRSGRAQCDSRRCPRC